MTRHVTHGPQHGRVFHSPGGDLTGHHRLTLARAICGRSDRRELR
jgi:hypothetical protein